MMTKTKLPEGWFYSDEIGVYQKVNKGVYAYIQPMLFGAAKLCLYMRGNTSMCELEARTKNDYEKMFRMGDEWLEKYKDGDLRVIHENFYSISNPEGAWGTKLVHQAKYWVD